MSANHDMMADHLLSRAESNYSHLLDQAVDPLGFGSTPTHPLVHMPRILPTSLGWDVQLP